MLNSLTRWLIRVRAYFRKEVNEIRRQPLLLLSLVVGPLLVLMIFGATFANSRPLLRTAVVLPEGGLPGITEEQLRRIAGTNFQIEEITNDRAAAEARLAAGQLDVVQVLPPDLLTALNQGERPQIAFVSNAINPLIEGWVQYLAYAEINEINKSILRSTTAQIQRQATDLRVKIVDANGQVAELEQGLAEAQRQNVQESLRATIAVLEDFERELPTELLLASTYGELADLRTVIARLLDNLRQLDRAISDGTLEQRLEQVRAARNDLNLLDQALALFVNLAPDAIVSPVGQSYTNIQGAAYAAVIYYAPGVLALLVQHTAVTLGALALVRERLMGAFEVFRVAPVSIAQLLIGKYLGYTLVIACSSTVLIAGLLLLGVPLQGSLWQFASLLLLLTLASLGLGFVISALSGSDSQAIQLAMILLLLSIFFSGFFITLDSFLTPALAVSYSLPMTHGVAGLQAIMLRGIPPTPGTWLGLAAISAVTFTLVVIITGRQMRKA